MPGSYRQISQYETEIINLYNQIRELKTRYNKKQRMIEARKAIHKKGRPCKNQNGSSPPSISSNSA